MTRFKYISHCIPASLALILLTTGCVREMHDPYDSGIRRTSPLNLDDISINASSGDVELDADKLSYDVTVHYTGGLTKAGIQNPDSATVAEVKLTSYKRGRAPMIPDGGRSASTKSLYDQVTTRDLNSNFLRLDETVGANDLATYEWPTWNNAYMLEANVIATPDNTDNLYYRTVTFNPSQAYNIRTFNVQEEGGLLVPKDTIFYHTRMVAWYPMMCTVPTGSEGEKATIQFKDNRYVQYRSQIPGTNTYGVVFDHQLDGQNDVMMSNMCEAQRYHRKFDGDGNPHYRDLSKSLPESNYRLPFGHNDNHPSYSNPMFYHHYLSAIRLWAKVDQSGDNGALSLLTWGQIDAVSVMNQPSTVTIVLPSEPSSAVSLDDDGNIVLDNNGRIKFDESQLVFGRVYEWSDYTNIPIRTELMFGEGDINHKDDQEVSYPIDMTSSSEIHGMDATYLGYCLIKPCAQWAEGQADETITLAITTQGGTYQAVIPCRAIFEDIQAHSREEIHVFDESKVYDITLNLKTSGTFSDFIGEEDENKFVDLSPYDETNGTYKTANCYVIAGDQLQARFDGDKEKGIAKELTPGYTFVGNIAGNGDAGINKNHGAQKFHAETSLISDATKAAVVWQSNEGQIINVQYLHGYVRFQTTSATPGNAVIAVSDDLGNVKWSWHIWIAENEPDKIAINSVEFMDRNLGALWHYSNAYPSSDADKVKSYGLYYQWGRKDPMPAPAQWNQHESTDISPVYDEYGARITDLGAYVFDQCNTLTDAIEHPMHFALCPFNQYYLHDWISTPIDFLWGETGSTGITSKSIYDPCPFGYRIVHEELQALMENNATTVEASAGNGLLVANGGKNIYLPYAGYFGPDRNYTSNTNSGFFMGQKGDYTCAIICPNTDATENEYFASHRLRTYISQATSWTSENVDGVATFTYNANTNKHYVESGKTTNKRDYGNRKTAGSVRCVSDGSYVRLAYAHIKSNTNSLEAGKNVVLDISAGVNLGGIKNAWLKASYTDEGGATHDAIVNFVVNDVFQTTDFLYNFDGTYNKLAIKGLYKFKLPDVLPADKYTFTFHVEEDSGDVKEDSCEVGVVGVTTESIVTTGISNMTDGVHPYAGETFTVVATLKAGPVKDKISVERTSFKINDTFSAATAPATGPDADGFYTVTVTFNNVHLDEAGLGKDLKLTGNITIDGKEFEWNDSIRTEVWEKVESSPTPLTLAQAKQLSGGFLIRNEGSSRYLYNRYNSLSLNGTSSTTNTYKWTISNNNIRSVSANTYYIRHSGSSTNFQLSTTNSSRAVFADAGNSSYYITIENYYMRDNNGSIARTDNTGDSNTRWYLFDPSPSYEYIDPHITGNNLQATGGGLYEGHPVAEQAFAASYSVTVRDADAVSVTSATIGGVAADATVTPSGDDFIVSLTADDITLSDSKKAAEVPVVINFRITSSTLGLNNASVRQAYAPTIDVWKRTVNSRKKGTQITNLDDLVDEDRVLMVNTNYNTRYTAANGTGLTSATTLATANDNQIWKVANPSGSNYTIQNVETGTYLVIAATNTGGNKWSYSTPSLGAATNLSLSAGSNFTISRYITSGTKNTTAYFRQTGNTNYAGNADTGNRTWNFYKVVETYDYVEPTE